MNETEIPINMPDFSSGVETTGDTGVTGVTKKNKSLKTGALSAACLVTPANLQVSPVSPLERKIRTW
jgi:hypothetical protein